MTPPEKSDATQDLLLETRKRRRRPRAASPARQPSPQTGFIGVLEGSGGSRRKTREPRLKRERTPFEWALLAVALAAIGTVSWACSSTPGTSPAGEAELQVEVADTGKRFNGGPQVEVTVNNVGGSGAEEIVTEVKMGEETREVTMPENPQGRRGVGHSHLPCRHHRHPRKVFC